MKHRLGYDDALDAFGVHGVGGALGALLTGVFASTAWNAAGQDGLISGHVSVLVEQVIAVAAAAAYSGVVTVVLLKLIDATIGLRVSAEEEQEGLDTVHHGEEAYSIGEARGLLSD